MCYDNFIQKIINLPEKLSFLICDNITITPEYCPSGLFIRKSISTKKRIRYTIYNEKLTDDCAICYTSDDKIVVKLINCRHIYHKECIDKVLENTITTCPICRTPIKYVQNI